MTRLRDAPFLADPSLRRVLDALDGAGEETRVVGGAVRNALLGLPVREVDLATTALPQETLRRAEAAGLKGVPTGIAHGTVTVVASGTAFEVTSLREDVETDGRHAVVRFGRDWARDAERRDFTMNALSVTREGEVIDTVGGLADLAARRVRFIGEPERRIREDYLRILRLFRFHAAYGEGPIDPPALAAAIRCREGVSRLSRERIGAEMMKLLGTRHAPAICALMCETGFLCPILGGVPDLAALARLARLEADLERAPDAVLRLAALGVRIAEDADRLRGRLRLSNETERRLAGAAADLTVPDDPAAIRRSLYALGGAGFSDLVLLSAARATAGRALLPSERVAPLLAAAQDWTQPVFPLRAAHFQAEGIAPGAALGDALRRAKAAWIAADFPRGDDALRAIVAEAARRPSA